MRGLGLFGAGMFVLCAVAMLGSNTPAVSQVSDADAACAELTKLMKGDVKILEARSVVAGPTPPFYGERPGSTAPAHCHVRGSFGSRVSVDGRKFETRFDLRMPRNWNGRFLFEGGGNMDGVDWPAYGLPFSRLSPTGLDRGFAVVRTNLGHDSTTGNSFDGALTAVNGVISVGLRHAASMSDGTNELAGPSHTVRG